MDIIEIERKFFVDSNKIEPILLYNEGSHIKQGYFSRDSAIRIRMTPKGCYITCKGEGTIARREVEVEIDRDSALAFYDLCPYKLEKIRYLVKFDGNIWEVDQYTGLLDGLFIAELELDSIDQYFKKPLWLGVEITENKGYTNHSLAVFGKPSNDWDIQNAYKSKWNIVKGKVDPNGWVSLYDLDWGDLYYNKMNVQHLGMYWRLDSLRHLPGPVMYDQLKNK